MSDSSDAVMTQKEPYAVAVNAGDTIFWCACGKSKNQPYCDGSHQGSKFQPVPYKAEKTETVYLCGCRKTSNQPLCDGSHSKL